MVPGDNMDHYVWMGIDDASDALHIVVGNSVVFKDISSHHDKVGISLLSDPENSIYCLNALFSNTFSSFSQPTSFHPNLPVRSVNKPYHTRTSFYGYCKWFAYCPCQYPL